MKYIFLSLTIGCCILFNNPGLTQSAMIIDNSFIESSRWVEFFYGSILYIQFKSGKYSIECAGECGDDFIHGKYIISGSKLILKPTDTKTYWSEFSKTTEWTVIKDDNDLMFTYKIIPVSPKGMRKKVFGREKSIVPINSSRIIGGTKALKVDYTEHKIIKNARMRKEPNISSEYYSVKINSNIIGYIEKGRTVFTLARTANKERIEDMNDYWYYCHTTWDGYSGEDGPFYCWIYGGLLK